MIDDILLDKLTDIGLEVGKSQINKKTKRTIVAKQIKKIYQ